MHSTIKHETLLALLTGIVVLLSMFITLKQISALDAQQWLLLAAGLWGYVCWQLWQRTALNRANEQAPLYPSLGWANRLTLLRGGLIALTGGFLFQPQSSGVIAWIPGALYAMAALLDRMDGFIARRTKQTSLLGSELDTTYDALGLLIAPVLAVGYGKLHWSFLLVSAAYYVFVWGIYWRRKHNQPIYPLMPSVLRRTLAGFQMGFVAFILLPCFYPPLSTLMGGAFMLPILLGFWVDWLVVSGRIPTNSNSHTFFSQLSTFSEYKFQPLLRVMLFFSVVMFVLFDTQPTSPLIQFILLMLVTAALLGFAARIASACLLIAITLIQGDSGVSAINATMIISSAWLMLLGSGRFSLWRGDDHWVNRRDGEDNN